ncbi:MAG: heavy metal translocating P-type ATPase [Oscillospiraceae bacterium]|nr:heavy metal translocating P-type ATPase [Oscillospiraceae bacterium]
MKCKILHESGHSMRVHLMQKHMSLAQADILEYYLRSQNGITDVKVFDRTCDVIINYNCLRKTVIQLLAKFAYTEQNASLVPEKTGRELNRTYEEKLSWLIIRKLLKRTLLPVPVRMLLTLGCSFRYILDGMKALLQGKIKVCVLDAAAIAASLAQGDYDTADSVMFLLKTGDILDEWTHRKSVDDLARTMSLGIEQVWLKTEQNEILVPVSQIQKGDQIIVRMGSVIPFDGTVISGDASVNQASMTGESAAVHKYEGCSVYAGTVIEEGACVIQVEKTSGSGKYDRIVQMIESSEKLKSQAENKASQLADRLVPWSFAGTILVYLLTGNLTKALSVLMVDFSCALKLSMPVAVLSAMRECSQIGITVKGGRFLEAVSQADTILFDKTGTLTYASPQVSQIITFGGHEENEMLRLAACLEEHFPHSVANAVVRAAAERHLSHEECHSKPEYIIAHGIASYVGDQRILIGSYHFIFEDEGCYVPLGEEAKFCSMPKDNSRLYLAISDELAAVICIDDPLRQEAADVIQKLHQQGIAHIVMMTGDSKHIARSVAKKVGVDEFYSEVLPEDKAGYIRRAHEQNRTVIMVGDGINDSPALSEADAGIAISTGAAIAREIADITISAENLYALTELRLLSDALMKRIRYNYRFIISFNSALLILGILGILPPALSAFLHNASTLAIGMKSMTNLKK